MARTRSAARQRLTKKTSKPTLAQIRAAHNTDLRHTRHGKLNMKHTTTDTFETDVLSNSKPTLVDFYADWCGPCRVFTPTLEKFDDANAGVEVYKLDLDANIDIARKYGVNSIPTIIKFEGGVEVKRMTGAMSLTELAAWAG